MIVDHAHQTITTWYGLQAKERALSHIDQGLRILADISASEYTRAAYCLHPMFQSDEDLFANFSMLENFRPLVVALILEFRAYANAWQHDKVKTVGGRIMCLTRPRLSPILEVNQMLMADKVQGFYTFTSEINHWENTELAMYFKCWFEVLEVDPKSYREYVTVMKS